MVLRDACRVPWRRTITRSSLFHLIRQNELKTGGCVLQEIDMSISKVWQTCVSIASFKVTELRSNFSVGLNPERFDKTGCTSQVDSYGGVGGLCS